MQSMGGPWKLWLSPKERGWKGGREEEKLERQPAFCGGDKQSLHHERGRASSLSVHYWDAAESKVEGLLRLRKALLSLRKGPGSQRLPEQYTTREGARVVGSFSSGSSLSIRRQGHQAMPLDRLGGERPL